MFGLEGSGFVKGVDGGEGEKVNSGCASSGITLSNGEIVFVIIFLGVECKDTDVELEVEVEGSAPEEDDVVVEPELGGGKGGGGGRKYVS